MVVCSRHDVTDRVGGPVWVEVPVDPAQEVRVYPGGRRLDSTRSTLEGLISLIDEIEELARAEPDPNG
jgi:hypothetical protein